MAIIVELQQEIEQQLEEEWHEELPRKTLEALAIESYRKGVLSRGQVSELLGISFHETEAFLKVRNACSPSDVREIQRGRAALDGLHRT